MQLTPPSAAAPRRVHRRRTAAVLSACAALLTGVAVAAPAQAGATPRPACAASAVGGPTSVGRFHGIARPLGARPSNCGTAAALGAEAPYADTATPPLLYNGGPVMGTANTGSVVITPIYWAPSGSSTYTFSSGYMSIIDAYVNDIAAASGAQTNVYSSLTQYAGSNGTIQYKLTAGTPIADTDALPASGCTVNSGSIYADGSSYSRCLDDDQVTAEIQSVVNSHSLPLNLGHIYMLMLPKHVESCFSPGNPSDQACTLNSTASAAYCAYHSAFGTTAAPYVYANMPYPIYHSHTGHSCTDEGLGGGVQSPNGDADADVEVSPLSHELSEAITDPFGDGWLDSAGNENGDDCAYIYGALSGSAGSYYNQTIDGDHYLTQEEFSNADFVPHVSGCVQQDGGTTTSFTPTVSSVSPASGPTGGGTAVTITGSNLIGATGVAFGGTAAASFSVVDSGHITATSPAGSAGTIDVTVTTPAGTSPTGAADQFGYATSTPALPTITRVSPAVGRTAGGQSVTITGANLTGATAVWFGGAPAAFSVLDDGHLAVNSPAGYAGPVDVTVTTPGGTSAVTTSDRYTYVRRPTITTLSPTHGTRAGGTTVTVTGTGFVPGRGTKVAFGSKLGKVINVLSSTRMQVRSPSHPAGYVYVAVATVGGVSPVKRSGDVFRFL